MARGPLSIGRPDLDTTRWRHRMAQLLKKVTTDDDVIEVWEHVTDMAKHSSDVVWANLFLAYTIGRPGSQDPSAAGVQIDGDLQLTVNNLSLEQLRAADQALKTIDATFAPVPDPTPAH